MQPNQAACNVMVVEDDRDAREMVALLMETSGYSVRTACDGLEALETIRAGYRPDAMILDLMMPRMDGSSLLGVLAGEVDVSKLAVVIVTASPATWKPAGFPVRGILRKPFELEELEKLIGEACSARA